MPWLLLSIAIAAEVAATSSLKLTDGFTRLLPSLGVAAGYSLAFYFLALTLRHLSVAVAYALWAGAGIALIALVGWLVFGEPLDTAGMIGIAFIIAGIVIINVFSQSVAG